jgi:nucleoside-diphosphate kinase
MTERTLIIIKPDAVQRQLMGKILTRFEEKGLKVVAAKFMHISQELARKHYAVHEGKPFFEGVVMSRKLMGETFGNEATPGTIRGDFGACRGYNLIHGSDAPETAEYEMGLYFKPEEIVDYKLAADDWLYGSND